MFCGVCGNPLEQDARFCSHCGARVFVPAPPSSATVPPVAPLPGFEPRVARHLQPLGVLWCLYGGLRLLFSLGIMALVESMHWRPFPMHGFGFPWFMGHGWWFGHLWVPGFMPIVAFATGASAVLSLVTGIALLARRPWARVLAIVAAVLSLIKIPFGTALGIYTLWVLAPAPSRAEYDALAEP